MFKFGEIIYTQMTEPQYRKPMSPDTFGNKIRQLIMDVYNAMLFFRSESAARLSKNIAIAYNILYNIYKTLKKG